MATASRESISSRAESLGLPGWGDGDGAAAGAGVDGTRPTGFSHQASQQSALPWLQAKNCPANRDSSCIFRGPACCGPGLWEGTKLESRIVQHHVGCCRGLTMPNGGAFLSMAPLDWRPAPSRSQRTEPLTFISGCVGRKEPSPANLRAWGRQRACQFHGRLMRILIAALIATPCQSVNRHLSSCIWDCELRGHETASQPSGNLTTSATWVRLALPW